MKDKLWCDLETDQEKAEFLRSGRAYETGIIADSIANEVAEAFEFRANVSGKVDVEPCGCNNLEWIGADGYCENCGGIGPVT